MQKDIQSDPPKSTGSSLQVLSPSQFNLTLTQNQPKKLTLPPILTLTLIPKLNLNPKYAPKKFGPATRLCSKYSTLNKVCAQILFFGGGLKIVRYSSSLESCLFIYTCFLLQFSRNSGKQSEETSMWIAYAAFHIGDYKKAMEVSSGFSLKKWSSRR